MKSKEYVLYGLRITPTDDGDGICGELLEGEGEMPELFATRAEAQVELAKERRQCGGDWDRGFRMKVEKVLVIPFLGKK
jgi:hypothetical protein